MKIKRRNFVAKDSHHMSGAGAHESKKGKRAKRAKQKRAWKKDVRAALTD